METDKDREEAARIAIETFNRFMDEHYKAGFHSAEHSGKIAASSALLGGMFSSLAAQIMRECSNPESVADNMMRVIRDGMAGAEMFRLTSMEVE